MVCEYGVAGIPGFSPETVERDWRFAPRCGAAIRRQIRGLVNPGDG
jgi:hypothetical protein